MFPEVAKANKVVSIINLFNSFCYGVSVTYLNQSFQCHLSFTTKTFSNIEPNSHFSQKTLDETVTG